MNKKYTHIFFDLDNTLWDFEKNSRLAMESTFTLFRLQEKNIQFETFFDVYLKHNTFLWSEYRQKKLAKKELTRLRFWNTFQELGISGIDPDKMNELYLTEMPEFNQLTIDTIEVLDYLKSKKYMLNIITNGFQEVQLKKLNRSGLEEYFEKIFISEVVKTPKPGREIFEYAIKSTNAKKRNSIMVGDDWEGDVLGALNFGIDAVFYHPNKNEDIHELPGKKDNLSIFFIKNMKQLMDLL